MVIWAAKVIFEDGEVDGVVLNISTGGAKVRLNEPLDHPVPVALRIDRIGELAGQVAWQNEPMIGIDFHEEPDVVAQRIELVLSRS